MIRPLLDELVKLGAVSDEHAQRSLDRLDSLERNRPTMGQLGRYGAIGAVAAPAIGAIGNVIRKKSPFEGATSGAKLRDAASMAVRGGLGASVIPMARIHSDRKAELGTLKKYVAEGTGEKTASDALGILSGLAAGFSPGRNLAGETAAAISPRGRVTRSENIARQAAIIGAPVMGLAAIALARKHGLTPKFMLAMQRHFPSGLIANPATERKIIDLAAPAAYAMVGSLLGGAATGALTGGVQRLRGAAPGYSGGGTSPPALKSKFEKDGDALPDGLMSYNPGDFKLVRFTKRGAALTPAGMLAHSRGVGMPKLTAPPGPSIAQIAKPKGAGFGTGTAGSFKGGIGGTAGTGYK